MVGTGFFKRCAGLVAVIVLVATVVASRAPGSVVAAGTGYVALASPARVLDTRLDGTTVDSVYDRGGLRAPGSTLPLIIAGRAGVPADAVSVVLNVTVTQPTGDGFITVYPCGAPQPTASNLNYVAGQTVPNMVIAKIGADGSVCLFSGSPTHLIVDVAGYFPGTDALTPLASPARLLDTRVNGTTIDQINQAEGIRPAGSTTTVQVTNRAAVPVGAASVVLNVTVDAPETAGYITVYPCDAPVPTASNLNYVAGQTVPNAVITKLSPDGTVCLYTSATTHLVADIAGYFANATVFEPLAAPARLLDSRPDGITIDTVYEKTGIRPGNSTMQLKVSDRALIPAGASAVVLNVTVDQPVASGFVTVYPTGAGARPNASNLNYTAGQTVPNAVIARLGAGGTVCLFNTGSTHLIVDVAGYLTGPAPAAVVSACDSSDVASDPPVPTTVPTVSAPPTTRPPTSTTVRSTTTTSTTTTTTVPPPVGPDGKIAFVRNNQIFTINPDGPGETAITRIAKNYQPQYSPDGDQIAYVHETTAGAHEIWVMDADGSDKVKVADAGPLDSGAAWSPDGTQLAFQTQTDGSAIVTLSNGLIQPLSGWVDDPADVRVNPSFEGTPSWSPDGTHLAYSTTGTDGSDQLQSYDLATDQIEVLRSASTTLSCPQLLADPVYSPDGQNLSYTYIEVVTDVTGDIECLPSEVGISPDGGFTSLGGDAELVFSPTQAQVVLTNAGKVYTADPDGGSRHLLATGTQPDWQLIP
jgi:hypothetical protein